MSRRDDETSLAMAKKNWALAEQYRTERDEARLRADVEGARSFSALDQVTRLTARNIELADELYAMKQSRDEWKAHAGRELRSAGEFLAALTGTAVERDEALSRIERATGYMNDVMAHSALCRREEMSGRGCHVCAVLAILKEEA